VSLREALQALLLLAVVCCFCAAAWVGIAKLGLSRNAQFLAVAIVLIIAALFILSRTGVLV
jgi:choline-glycine betaine transporter